MRITLTEGTLIRPVRVELRYDPGRIPKGMPEEALFIARYDEASQRWIGLVSSQVDATQKLVVAEVERFSMLQVMSFEPGWLLDKAFQSFQKVFGGGVIDLRFFKVTITTPSRYIGSRKATRQSPFPFVPAKR